MKNSTKLTQTPETNAAATARFAIHAELFAVHRWGQYDAAVTETFSPANVARLVAEELAPKLLVAREIAELERDVAQIKLGFALRRIAELEAAVQA